MPYSTRVLPLAVLLALGVSCSPDASKKDPVAEAQFQNEKRIGDENVTKKQEHDAEFMVEAASDGMLEVELGKLAQQKATQPAVKNFGQHMVEQHSEANTALKTLAEKKGLVLPTSLGQEQQETYGKLATLTGTQFDKQYMAAMVDAHKKDVDAFEDMSEDAYDGDIRGFAAKYAPVLKEHLDMAKQVNDQVEDLP
jgi:putative membrane protein